MFAAGSIIPEGVFVFLHLKHIHENPAFYPNPGQWNPDNFNQEAVDARPKNSFAAFGLGLRTCLGTFPSYHL